MRCLRPLLVATSLLGAGDGWANALDHLRTKDDIGLNKVPSSGISRVLVIPVRVGSGLTTSERNQLESIFDPAGGVGTFREYWQVNSGGRYDPMPVLVDPVVYTDRCPIPGKTLSNCTFSLNDLGLISSKGLKTTLEDILGRVRDEQDVDLTQFDINGVNGTPDGYFDGLIIDTDMYSGIGFPLAALDNTAVVSVTPGQPDAGATGATLTAGIVAMIPPELHEYGHVLGFIDLYGGPTVNDLMKDIDSTLGAFSRLQIGWGEATDVTGDLEIDLPPVLEGGTILRFGSAPRYVLVENRGGTQHGIYDESHPGIYVYSVDESELPTDPLGFIDIFNRTLYLPNQDPPYLFVNMPVDCNLGSRTRPGTCALAAENEGRVLTHASGESVGFAIRRGATQPEGTIHLSIRQGTELPPEIPSSTQPDAGTTTTPPSEEPSQTGGCASCELATASPLALLALLLRRRRSCSGSRWS
ncbi:MAG: hypothetical protein AB2A00_35805 [Myxococcota bacterium]